MSGGDLFDLHKNWMELFFLVLMIIGVFIALVSPSAIISYIIIFLAGIFAGRLMYERKNKIQFPYLVVIGGFVIGYLLGGYYGSRLVFILMFALGYILSYKVFEKRVIKDILYRQ